MSYGFQLAGPFHVAAGRGCDLHLCMRIESRFTICPATYFDLLLPDHDTGKPTMLLVHGGAHTGACWLSTADGGPGWARRFVDRGYPVAVPDWPGTGRSGYMPPDQIGGELVAAGLARVLDSIGTARCYGDALHGRPLRVEAL